MLAIANEETRESLRTVFEKIFEKYGKEFNEDDEIDLINLEVAKAGGHLARIKPVKFGRAYRDRRHRRHRESQIDEGSEHESEEETITTLRNKVKRTKYIALAGARGFDGTLRQIIAQERGYLDNLIGGKRHYCNKCFDCILLETFDLNKKL